MSPDAPPAPAAFEATATKLDAAAQQLRDQHVLVTLQDAVAATHATDRWKREQARARDYKPLEPDHVGKIVADLHALADQFADSAGKLRSGFVGDAIDTLRLKVDATYAAGLGSLSSDTVDELVFVREHVCAKKPDPICSRQGDLSKGFDEAIAIAKLARRELTDAATALEAAPELDAHAKVVLQRATGKGPRYGEACGPEDLCAWEVTCMPETHTCERECFEGAMQPCPANLRCMQVPKLSHTVCR